MNGWEANTLLGFSGGEIFFTKIYSTSIKEKVLVKESEVDVVLRRLCYLKRVKCVTSMCLKRSEVR